MTKQEQYDRMREGIMCQSTHDGLTGWANHALMHLDYAYNITGADATGDELQQAYDDEQAECLACKGF